MARNAKVYGKQRTNELFSAFQNLDLNTPQKGVELGLQSKVNSLQQSSSDPDVDIKRLPALSPVTGNKRRAHRVENDCLKDGPAVLESALQLDKIPSPHTLEMTAPSAERTEETNTKPKLTSPPRLARAVSAAKEKALSASISGVPDLVRRRVRGKKEENTKKKAKSKARCKTHESPDEITALTSLDAVDTAIKNIDDMFKTWQEVFTITKIAQGSFGSILRTQMKSDPSNFTVCKLMPIKRVEDTESDGSLQTYIKDAAAEVRVLDRMSESPGFVQFRSAHVLEGELPSFLVDMSQEWDKDHPKDKTPTDHLESQLWLLIEMSDAGTDLATLLREAFPDGTYLNKKEKGAQITLYQAWDIFWSVVEALAHGEMNAEFEHRDLHPGNICIKRKPVRRRSNSDEGTSNLAPRYTDLEVTLIDYTLSRVILENGEDIYNSMDDDALFEGKGRSLVDRHQYNTYRHMRDIVRSDLKQPLEVKIDNPWSLHCPKTNLLWLHHILFVLLKETERSVEDQVLADTLASIQSDLNPPTIRDCTYKGAKGLVEAYMDGAYG